MSEHIITTNLVLGVLGGHIGEKNGISARLLALKLTNRQTAEDTRAAERRIRQVITELRNEGFHICGTPDAGYYLAANAAELDRTCAFLYSRAMASLQQIARMKKVSVPDLRGQLRLPT